MATQEKPQNGYVGVNLRADRSNLADDKQVTRAINVDFNKELGTASIRNGRYELADLADDVVRLIAKVNGARYYVAGRTLYRNGVAVSLFPVQLDSTLVTDIKAFRPLNDLAIWAFIADIGNRERMHISDRTDGRGHSAMKKDDGTRTQKWGIGEPRGPLEELEDTSSVTAAYIWNLTYIRFDRTNTENPLAVAHEGNPISRTQQFNNPV